MNPTKKGREMSPERIYDMLLNARTADKVTLRFKDGRIVQGALIFNPFKGTGRLINIDRETSIDFMVDDIRELKLTPLPVKESSKPAPAAPAASTEETQPKKEGEPATT